MNNEQPDSTLSILCLATVLSHKSPPPWMAAAILLLNTWKQRGLLEQLQQIHWNRPAKRYVFCDLVLVLLVMSVSNARGVRDFYKQMWAWRFVLAALWGRKQLPSRPHLNRLLHAVTAEQIELFRSLFLSDLIAYSPAHALLGLNDHLGKRHLFFDLDPTKLTVLERELPGSDERPAGQRLRTAATAPGYPGRKRADRVRSRMTVLCPHTGMWIYSFGQPGNGRRVTSLEGSIEQIKRVVEGWDVPLSQTVLRLDGEGGHLKELALFHREGMGYLKRVSEYSILQWPQIQAVLAQGSGVQLRLPDSPVQREIFDVPGVPWRDEKGNTWLLRFVVTRHAARTDGKKEGVGHRIGDWVYEIFVTTLTPEEVSAAEVVSLYLWRGAFEAVLGQEDAEMATDRWITNAPTGEDLWQILCQWIWNQRVQMGLCVLDEEKVKRLLGFEVPITTSELVPIPWEMLPTEPIPPETPSEEDDLPSTTQGANTPDLTKKKKGYWGPEAFIRDEEGTVRCPQGVEMPRRDRRRRVGGWRERYVAPAEKCAVCPVREQCRRPHSSDLNGRRVDLPEWLPQTPVEGSSASTGALSKAQGAPEPKEEQSQKAAATAEESAETKMVADEQPTPVATAPSAEDAPQKAKPFAPILQWNDLAASQCRHAFDEQLRSEQVQVTYEEIKGTKGSDGTKVLETRDQRAHRRLTWDQRLQRNARPADAPRMFVELTGIPARLAEVAGLHLLQGEAQMI